VVADQLAAAAGEDGRSAGEACPVLLASLGGEPSDAPPLRVDGMADRVVAPASGIGRTAGRADLSDERATDGEVSETSVKRGLIPRRSGPRRAKSDPLCGHWRGGAARTRPSVEFGAGQMYAAQRRQH